MIKRYNIIFIKKKNFALKYLVIKNLKSYFILMTKKDKMFAKN